MPARRRRDRLRTLVGISIFWVGLSVLGDGFASLVVPAQLAAGADPAWAATVIGGVTFVGLIAGMLTQPVAGRLSDRLYPRWGRRGLLGLRRQLLHAAARRLR